VYVHSGGNQSSEDFASAEVEVRSGSSHCHTRALTVDLPDSVSNASYAVSEALVAECIAKHLTKSEMLAALTA